MKGLVIAAPHSGAGKTSLSLALMAALKRRGLAVQAFKVGPDFIDPGHHALATGRPSHNLDGWMLSRAENRSIFARHAADADVCVVEGVMGLYDGFSGSSEEGSSAQMAKWLGLPVLLTVNAKAMARSLAALALGFVRFDPKLSWAGLVANRVGSAAHLEMLREALKTLPELPLMGGLLRNPEISMPERHLGLVTAEEGGLGPDALERLADWLEQGVDLDRLLQALPELAPPPPMGEAPGIPAKDVRIAVPKDQAFCFYYPESLRRLEAAGAELVYFSPINGESLPPGIKGLYMGGGYPELFASRLADNHRLREDVAHLGKQGMPIYAECGGMMFLGQTLEDLEGNLYPMAGLLPIRTRMLSRLKSLGYREVEFTKDTPFGPAGVKARGHEFHYSELSGIGGAPGFSRGVYRAAGRKGPLPGTMGFGLGNTLASYVHLHLGSNPELAPAFVDACRRAGKA